MSVGARIVDTGYRPYEGQRGGLGAAVRSVAVHSVRRALGLRRSARAKALPVLIAALAFIPAVVIVGVLAFLQVSLSRVLHSYADYYGFINVSVVAFAALVVPEVLCPDRRSGMLRVYLAAPLDGLTYVLAKATAVGAVLLVVTLGPPLFLLVGLTLEGAGPGGVADVATMLARILASSLALSAIYGALALAVAGMTDRRAAASTAIVLLLVVPGVTVPLVVNNLGATQWLYLLDIADVASQLVRRIFGESGAHPDLPAVALAGAAVIWAAAAAAALVARYRDAGRRR